MPFFRYIGYSGYFPPSFRSLPLNWAQSVQDPELTLKGCSFSSAGPRGHLGVSENKGCLIWGVLIIIRILPFRNLGYYIRVPYFRKLPFRNVLGPGHFATFQSIAMGC